MLLYLAKFLSLAGCRWKRRSHMWRGRDGGAGGRGFLLRHRFTPPPRPLETPPDWETSAPTARASCAQKRGDLHLLPRLGDYTVVVFFFFLYPDSCVFHCATLSSYTLYHLWILEHCGLPAVFQPQNPNKKQRRGSSTGNLLCCLLSPGKWLSSPFERSSLLALLLMWPGPLHIS